MNPQAEGTEPEFSAWLDESRPFMVAVARMYTKDPHHAEDVTQLAAIRISRYWAKDDIREKIISHRAYVHTIVKNCYLDYRKARLRIEAEVELDADRQDTADAAYPEVRAAISNLPDSERAMILAHYYGGYSMIEVGEAMGLSRDQAHRLHKKAIAQLKALLELKE